MDFACPVRRSTRPQVPRHSTGTCPPRHSGAATDEPGRRRRAGQAVRRPGTAPHVLHGLHQQGGGWRSRTRTPRPPPNPEREP